MCVFLSNSIQNEPPPPFSQPFSFTCQLKLNEARNIKHFQTLSLPLPPDHFLEFDIFYNHSLTFPPLPLPLSSFPLPIIYTPLTPLSSPPPFPHYHSFTYVDNNFTNTKSSQSASASSFSVLLNISQHLDFLFNFWVMCQLDYLSSFSPLTQFP